MGILCLCLGNQVGGKEVATDSKVLLLLGYSLIGWIMLDSKNGGRLKPWVFKQFCKISQACSLFIGRLAPAM